MTKYAPTIFLFGVLVSVGYQLGQSAEAPSIKCEDARDQWQARFEISQQRINELEGRLAYISVEAKKLKDELDKVKKPVKK